MLLLHLYLHDQIAVPVLLPLAPSSVLLGYSVYRPDMQATAQLYDSAIAVAYRLLRELCGPSWKPQHVQFAHGRPPVVSAYRRAFGAPVRFDAEVSGLMFRSSWLDRPIDGADPVLCALLSQAIMNAAADESMTFAQQVQRVLHQMILGGTSSVRNVARLFAMSERTLRLRLRAEGTSPQRLLDQARFALAQQLMQNTQLPLSDIAAALRYADPPTFSRAFRNWAKRSPRQWRASQIRGAI